MKKTFNINVAGYPFVIDEDAYQLMKEYLNTIENAFKATPDNSELVNDIESRIAELLLEISLNGSHIITLDDVETIIARIGQPEEMIENDEYISINEENDSTGHVNEEVKEEIRETSTTSETRNKNPFYNKKLYRDPVNGMLGGVCSGLSWYLGWDVTWIRILVIALTICSFSTVAIVYAILWVVVPAAETPLQRMQMMGEEPTMENIGKTVTDTFMDDQGIRESQARQTTKAPQAVSSLASGASLIVKILIIAGLIIACPVLLSLVVGLIGCVFFLLMWGSTLLFGCGLPFYSNIENIPDFKWLVLSSTICAISWIITLGIPIGVLVFKGIKPGVKISSSIKRLLILVWILGFIAAGISTGTTVSKSMSVEETINTQRKQRIEQRELAKTPLDRARETLRGAEKNLSKAEKNQEKALEKFQKATEKALKAREKAVTKANSNNSRLEEMAIKAAGEAEEKYDKAVKNTEEARKRVDEAKSMVDSLTVRI